MSDWPSHARFAIVVRHLTTSQLVADSVTHAVAQTPVTTNIWCRPRVDAPS